MTSRRAALNVLVAVIDRDAYCNLSMKRELRDLCERDRAFAAALAYGVLDHLYRIDAILSAYLNKRADHTVMNILRMGVCELVFLNTPSHAAISQCVNLCKEIGKAPVCGFVNAVLHKVDLQREQLPPLPERTEDRLSQQYSFPLWLVRQWIDRFGAGFAESLLSSPPAPLQLRAQWPCCKSELLQDALPPDCVSGRWDTECIVPPKGWDAAHSPAFRDGKMTIQSEGAMLVCRALGDMRAKRVLDACAAPGGKTAYVWSLCEGDVAVTAWELHQHRKDIMDQTLERLHVAAVTKVQDASVYDPAYAQAFDAVLVDAPCSGLGMLFRKPDIRYKKNGEDVEALAALQGGILHACSRYVRPQGILLYATCTISQMENEEQVLSFLKAHPDFSLEAMPLPIENDGMLQLYPSVHGTDGFFMARLKKCG